MNFAESPPAFKKLFICRDLPVPLDVRSKISHKPRFHRLGNPRHRHQHGYTLTLDRVDYVAGFEVILKEDRPGDDRRDEHAHGLAKDMAQRQHVQKTYGVKDALVLAILWYLALNGIHAGKYVAMREHY